MDEDNLSGRKEDVMGLRPLEVKIAMFAGQRNDEVKSGRTKLFRNRVVINGVEIEQFQADKECCI